MAAAIYILGPAAALAGCGLAFFAANLGAFASLLIGWAAGAVFVGAMIFANLWLAWRDDHRDNKKPQVPTHQ